MIVKKDTTYYTCVHNIYLTERSIGGNEYVDSNEIKFLCFMSVRSYGGGHFHTW